MQTKVLKPVVSLMLILAMMASIVLPYASSDAATAPKSIKITTKTKEVAVSKTLKLKYSLSPKKASSKITWSTSNKKVATVNKKGVVSGKSAGTATITAKTANGKTAKTTITVTGGKAAPGTVLWDQKKQKKASERKVVRKYDDYKYHVSAIWLHPYNLYYDGRDKKVGKAVNNKGLKLKITGKFKMAGPEAKEILMQLNYTQPKSYPIIWQYPKDEKAMNSGQKIVPNKTYKVDCTFTIPENAVNGDKDDNGYNWPILLYFANKPNNKMIYKKGNDFTFWDFKITVVK